MDRKEVIAQVGAPPTSRGPATRLEVDADELFDLVVLLLKAEKGLDSDIPFLAEGVTRLYQLGFGPVFIDGEGPELDAPDCYAPLYRLAEEQAEADPEVAASRKERAGEAAQEALLMRRLHDVCDMIDSSLTSIERSVSARAVAA